MGRLSNFMALYSSKSTQKTYVWAIGQFCESVYGEVNNLEEAVEKYFAEERDYEADVKKFFSKINERPPKSIRLLLSCIKTFLLENKVELGELFWKRLNRRIKGTRAVTVEKVPSNTELRRILTHMPVHGKALYLTLTSSGMRIGEALELKLDDVDLEVSPVKINIRREYTKSGDARITFVTEEAKESLEEWLKQRDSYLKTAVQRSHFYEKSLEDERLFPFSTKTASDIWTNALDKAELNGRDKTTNRHKIHPHVLRKFFRAKAGMVSVDMAEALMGHTGYLTDVYRKYADPEETLAEFYKKVEPSLEVFGRTGEQFVKLKEETTGLQAVVNRLTLDNMALNKRLEKGEERRRKMEKEIEKLKRGDADIDKIVEVLGTLINAPLGYSGEQDENWFDRAMGNAEKIIEELKQRRLKS